MGHEVAGSLLSDPPSRTGRREFIRASSVTEIAHILQ
jgi:hypothetical protein